MKRFGAVVLALVVLGGCGQQADAIEATKVIRVIDGDTIEVVNQEYPKGKIVRVLGIDTPERKCPGYQEAKKNMQDLVLAKRIILVPDGKQDTDKYGRLVRYIDLGGRDIGLQQIKGNYADARYDSRDGYPKHSREDKYIEEDKEKNPPCPSK